MDGQALKRDLLAAFEYAHRRDDWVTPLDEALAGLTAAQALWRPGPHEQSIWDIVRHMAVWTENCLERAGTGEHRHPAEGAWPAPPPRPDEAAWRADRERLERAVTGLRHLIDSTEPDSLTACSIGNGQVTWSPLLEILGRFVHNAYHLGQVVKLRECMPANPSPGVDGGQRAE